MSDDLIEIKRLLKTDKLVIGKEETIKRLKTTGLEKVYTAKNCPADVQEDLAHYAEMVKVPLIVLSLANDELGDLCKKSFFISVLGVAKE